MDEDVEEHDEDDDGGRRLSAREFMAERTTTSTKVQYKNMVKHMADYLQANWPEFYSPTELSSIVVPLSIAALEGLFGYLPYRGKSNRSMLSKSSISGYRNALVDIHTQRGIAFPADQKRLMTQLMRGYGNVCAQEKQKGRMSFKEGKDPLTRNAYRNLARIAIERCNDASQILFNHCYLLLDWNLMSRVSSVGELMFEHIRWENDALLITFERHKGDQDGSTCNKEPKHVYANPHEPWICPILALGVLILSTAYRTHNDEEHRVFRGARDDARFAAWLRTALTKLTDDEQQQFELFRQEIATHSVRKGALTGFDNILLNIIYLHYLLFIAF